MSWASTPRLLPSQRCPDIFSTISDSNHPARRTAYCEISSGQCEALDGLKDGLISDPARCQFDPAALLCEDDDSSNCLTAPQVQLARQIYSSAKNPRTGQEIYPGLEPGSELGWTVHAGPEPLCYGTDGFKYVTYSNPDWDFRGLNLDSDAAADKADAGLSRAINPDLKDFFGSGEKLLMYQRWSDQNIAPLNTVIIFKMSGRRWESDGRCAAAVHGPRNGALWGWRRPK